MPNRTEISESLTGDDDRRVDISYDDGSHRQITETDNETIVTDTSPSGDQDTGDGATGILGILSDATRLNSR